MHTQGVEDLQLCDPERVHDGARLHLLPGLHVHHGPGSGRQRRAQRVGRTQLPEQPL